jgi:hypothetical protein
MLLFLCRTLLLQSSHPHKMCLFLKHANNRGNARFLISENSILSLRSHLSLGGYVSIISWYERYWEAGLSVEECWALEVKKRGIDFDFLLLCLRSKGPWMDVLFRKDLIANHHVTQSPRSSHTWGIMKVMLFQEFMIHICHWASKSDKDLCFRSVFYW